MISKRLAGGVLALTASTSIAIWAQSVTGSIGSLKGVSVPEPSASELAKYVTNKQLATAIGKALFWDMQVGSDGVQSCATCHFKAGADNRSFNQVSPTTASLRDTVFSIAPVNSQLSAGAFPFNANDVVSSQGICRAKFAGIAPGSSIDASTPLADPVFNVGGRNVRRVEPRNTPTSTGAAFNHRNFWDGRAKNVFNGVSPFGDQDPAARVAQLIGSSLQAVRISIPDSSLASQAVGPPTSDFEMSYEGRTFPDVGRKMLALGALAKQKVSTSDTLLGSYANASGNGAFVGQTYASLIRSAFHSQWWNGTQIVVVNPDRSISFRASRTGAANEYTQMEYNFSLFFGLAVQLYEATQNPNDSKFDRYESRQGSFSSLEVLGREVFTGKGKCANCHGGTALTNASVENAKNKLIERMIMGNGAKAVYDNGFYNIGVRPTSEDLGVGATDPFGNPLSFSRLFQRGPTFPFVQGDPSSLSGTLSPSERVAVDGAHKTSALRNVALTAPYFWNGGKLTLRQVVDFYNAGGDFAHVNIADLDPDIVSLGLSNVEKEALVAFMNTLTDDRVKFHRGPFDHPSLDLPLGGAGCAGTVPPGGPEQFVSIPAVGSAGYSSIPASLGDFLGVNQNDANVNGFNVNTPVNLSGQYNVNAIVSSGTRPTGGGLDNTGNAYSSSHLGPSVSWSGHTFTFGGANTLNGLTSKVVTLPQGQYGSLKMLGSASYGTKSVPVVINYTDGTSTTQNVSFTDWKGNTGTPISTAAKNMTHAVNSFGSLVDNKVTAITYTYILFLPIPVLTTSNYGWQLYGVDVPVEKTRIVKSVTLPSNRNVVVLGMSLAPLLPAGTFMKP